MAIVRAANLSDITSRVPGAVADNVADDTTALTADLAALHAGATVDLGGRSYKTTSPLVLSKAVTIRNGTINAGTHNAIQITAAGVVLGPGLTLTRSSSAAAVGDSLAARSLVQATAPFVSENVTYSGTNHACVYLGHAQCDGTTIRGGSMTNTTARQNAGGVYVAAGGTGNYDITVRDVTVTGACSDGITFFDANRCKVIGCKVSGMTRLATVTTSGWVLQSGSIYRSRSASGTPGSTGVSTDRADGNTRVVTSAGTQLTENTSTPSSPTSNQWGITGGYLYINLGGTDPNTVTVTSDIVSGYGIQFYSTSGGFQDMSHNLVAQNTIRNVDGFGIYMQLSSYANTCKHNTTMGNHLRDVCKVGSQHAVLPFAGLAWNGGIGCMSIGDQIDTIGTSGFTAPGFYASDATQPCRGVAKGVTVANGTAEGFRIHAASDWTYDTCVAESNTLSGFRAFLVATPKRGIELNNCRGAYNTIRGVDLDGTAGLLAVTINGGTYHNNAQQGIQCTLVRNTFLNGVTLHDNGVTSFHQVRFVGDCVDSGFTDLTMYHLLAGQSISVASGQTGPFRWGPVSIRSNMAAPVDASLQVRVSGGAGGVAEYTGSGAPTIGGALGDRYRRTGTPSTSNQREYICTTAGAAGAAVWTGIL